MLHSEGPAAAAAGARGALQRTPLGAPAALAAGAGGGASLPNLLDECWICVMSFLSPKELCSCAYWSARHRALANSDDLWARLCRRLWADKQHMPNELFRNGDYSLLNLSVQECKSLLKRRGVAIAGVTEKSELLAKLQESTPRVIEGQPLPIPGKWKTSYAFAEVDSRRQAITAEEVSHFRWQLIYHGRPSSMGLRHFQRNGVYVSPHFGETTWHLDGRGYFVMQGVEPLQVRRDATNWGWLIGAGSGTEYLSVEP